MLHTIMEELVFTSLSNFQKREGMGNNAETLFALLLGSTLFLSIIHIKNDNFGNYIQIGNAIFEKKCIITYFLIKTFSRTKTIYFS